MKKAVNLIIVFVAVIAAACSSSAKEKEGSQKTSETVTIAHAADTVEVPVNPGRVVVLGFRSLENLELVDANVVGIPKTGLPHYLSKYEDDSSITNVGNLVEVNMETINELQPDLIILGVRLTGTYEEMSEIAPTIIPKSDTEDPLGALKHNMDNLGKIFNQQDAFDKAFEKLQEKIADIKKKTSPSDAEALVVLHNRGRFSAYGSGSRFGLVHDVAGIKEAVTDLDTHLHGTRVSNEFIQEANPDILFVVDRSAAIGDQPLNKSDIENELIRQTNAYKNDKIIYLDPAAWYLSGGGGITSMNIMIDEVAQAFE